MSTISKFLSGSLNRVFAFDKGAETKDKAFSTNVCNWFKDNWHELIRSDKYVEKKIRLYKVITSELEAIDNKVGIKEINSTIKLRDECNILKSRKKFWEQRLDRVPATDLKSKIMESNEIKGIVPEIDFSNLTKISDEDTVKGIEESIKHDVGRIEFSTNIVGFENITKDNFEKWVKHLKERPFPEDQQLKEVLACFSQTQMTRFKGKFFKPLEKLGYFLSCDASGKKDTIHLDVIERKVVNISKFDITKLKNLKNIGNKKPEGHIILILKHDLDNKKTTRSFEFIPVNNTDTGNTSSESSGSTPPSPPSSRNSSGPSEYSE